MSVAKTLPEASHAPNSTEATQTSQRPPKRRRVRGSSRQSLIAIALERQLGECDTARSGDSLDS